MKILKNISILLLTLLAFAACSEDDKMIYNPDNVAEGELKAIETSYVLEAEKAGNVKIPFVWGATDFGFSAEVTYKLEMDLAGKDFANIQILASNKSTSAEITGIALNSAMMQLKEIYGFQPETQQNIEFRVRASISDEIAPVFTNVITSLVTPFEGEVDYPKVWVVGDYSGWGDDGWDNEQHLFDFTGTDVYEGWIFFDGKAANGFKISGIGGWQDDCNWGVSEQPASEAANVNIICAGSSSGIQSYSQNYYKFSFDRNGLVMKKEFSMNTFGIIGSGVGGWEATNDIPMTFDTERQEWTVTTTLQDGEIKFRADKTWGDVEFGAGDTEGALKHKGGNIVVTAGTYKIVVNLNNSNDMTIKMTAGTALDPSKITAPVLNVHENKVLAKTSTDEISWSALDFGDQEGAAVTYTVELALAGTEFATTKVLGTSKIASLTVKGDDYLNAVKELGGDAETETNIEIRVITTVSGITDNFTSNVVAYSVTVKNEVALPANMYFNGTISGWEWTAAKEMIPVNSHPGMFWGIYYFDAGAEFKFAPVRDWNGDFGTASDGQIEYGNVEIGGNNIKIKTAGFYQILVSCLHSEDKQSVVKSVVLSQPKPYLFGDGAPGGWEPVESNAFKLENDLYVSPAMTADKAVRMCIKLDGCDWWQTEFNVFDGVIEYRGTGGDQSAVNATAGQVVKLNFKDNTGTIQ